MYNTDFLSQIEAFRRNLFGVSENRGVGKVYSLPPDIKVVPCFEDINGEGVPNPSKKSGLEAGVS